MQVDQRRVPFAQVPKSHKSSGPRAPDTSADGSRAEITLEPKQGIDQILSTSTGPEDIPDYKALLLVLQLLRSLVVLLLKEPELPLAIHCS